MECDFCLAVPYRRADYVVACVVCHSRFNCCRDCWRSAEHNHYHCKPKKSGAYRRIVADIDGRVVNPRKNPDDDEASSSVMSCLRPELAVRVLVGPLNVPLANAEVELCELGTVIETDFWGMAYFGKPGVVQPTLRARKRGHVASNGQRDATYSFRARGHSLTTDTTVDLWLDFTCEGGLAPNIKLANSARIVSRAELEQAYLDAAGRRRSLADLVELLMILRQEIDEWFESSKKAAADAKTHREAIATLEQFAAEFGTFFDSAEVDPVDREEALNAAIALVNTLLRPPPPETLLEIAEDRDHRLKANQEALAVEIQKANDVAASEIEVKRSDIVRWQGQLEKRKVQIDKAEKAILEITEKCRKSVEFKKGESARCIQARELLQAALRSDSDEKVRAAILTCEQVLKRRPVSGPPQPFAKPTSLQNQFDLRKKLLADREGNPLVVTLECSVFSPNRRWHPYVKLCDSLSSGITILGLMDVCDVWARRTGAANDVRVVGAHECDGAFIPSACGITEVRIVPQADGFKFVGGGGLGEKVFAFGCKGAFGFRSDFPKREERFYAILLPKDFTFHFGYDIRCLGVSGASARQPSFEECRDGFFMDPKEGHNRKRIDIPVGKLFFIRAEESTDEGQITIQFGFRQMLVNGERISMVDFLRRQVLGVVEFDRSGKILQYQLFKPE